MDPDADLREAGLLRGEGNERRTREGNVRGLRSRGRRRLGGAAGAIVRHQLPGNIPRLVPVVRQAASNEDVEEALHAVIAAQKKDRKDGFMAPGAAPDPAAGPKAPLGGAPGGAPGAPGGEVLNPEKEHVPNAPSPALSAVINEELDSTRPHLNLWRLAMKALRKKMTVKAQPPHLYYFIREARQTNLVNRMEHLTCFVPGMLVMGYYELPHKIRDKSWLNLAYHLMETCVQLYRTNYFGLACETTEFRLKKDIDEKNLLRCDGEDKVRGGGGSMDGYELLSSSTRTRVDADACAWRNVRTAGLYSISIPSRYACLTRTVVVVGLCAFSISITTHLFIHLLLNSTFIYRFRA